MSGKDRLLWVELVRIVSMLMIITLHICGQGGVIYNMPVGTASYYSAQIIESLCYCSVNCYAIITGYVMYDPSGRRFKYSRIVPLWLQVFYYSAIITLLFAAFMPGKVSSEDIWKGFTPLISSQYWYFTAYFGMFFFIPFFNILIDALDKNQFIKLIVFLFVIFSFLPFTLSAESDLFNVKAGYSTLWLCIMYFAGAFIKRCGSSFKIKRRIWALCYVISAVLPCIGPFILIYYDFNVAGIDTSVTDGWDVYNYTSPFTVISAVSLFMLFKDIDIRSRVASRAIGILSPAAFGIYLIHVHPLVFEHIVKNRMTFLINKNCFYVMIGILAVAAAAYIILAAAEYIRIMLFKALKVRERSEELVSKIMFKVKNMKLK